MYVSHSDEELRDMLHLQRRRAPATVKSIVSTLKILRENHIDLSNAESLIAFTEDKSVATRRQYAMNAMTYLTMCEPSHPSIKEFRTEMNSCNAQLQTRYEQNSFTNNQQRNHVEWDELMQRKRELDAEVDSFQNVNTVKQVKTVYEHLLLSMYTDIPPQRAEFCNVRIVTNDSRVGNVYVKGAMGDDKLILRNYKTAKTYGKKEIAIPPTLSATVRRSLRLVPRDFLFANVERSGPTSRSSLKERMARIFPDRRVGCNLVRKITKTEFSKRGEPGALKLAKHMGHSIATAERFYNNHRSAPGPNSMGLHL